MASPSPPATKASPLPPPSDDGDTTSPPSPSDESPPPSPPSPPAQSPPQSPPESPPKSPPSSSPPPPPSPTPPPSPPSTSSPPPPPLLPMGSPPPPPENGDSASPSPPNSTPQAPPKSGSQDKNNNNPSSSGALPSPPRSSPKHGKSSSSGDDNNRDGPSSKKDDQSSGGGNQAIVVGVVAGLALFILLISVSALVCYCRRRKNRKAGGRDYYNNNGSAPPKWRGQGGDHNIKIPPPPGMGGPPGGGWQHGPPAPMSSEMSSTTYSGPHGQALPPPSPTLALGFNKSTFTYEELAAATGGFSQSNMIGQGGFGYVFKGVLPNGKDVAVKQLKSGSGQGEREFQAEVEIISRVHHRHLVSLVGYCITGAQRLLIYEFVPNKTLEYHLHGKGLPTMDWPTRMKIAIGSAKGLAYLHEDCHPRIIHRDIKSANILLDYKFEAMVADFGLAKLSSDTNTHVSTRVMGTFGYLAPEYASSGKLTDKSDVFSYGVMLLELISGRRPVDHTNRMEDSLVDWARPILGQILSEENYGELADPNLEGNYNTPEMARMMACAAACVRHSARKRPKMSQIVRALEGDMISFDDLNEGVKPGQSSMFGSSGSDSTFESTTYSSKMREFQRVALASGEYTGEYSGVTSEYGLNPSESSGSSGETQFGAGRKPRQEV